EFAPQDAVSNGSCAAVSASFFLRQAPMCLARSLGGTPNPTRRRGPPRPTEHSLALAQWSDTSQVPGSPRRPKGDAWGPLARGALAASTPGRHVTTTEGRPPHARAHVISLLLGTSFAACAGSTPVATSAVCPNAARESSAVMSPDCEDWPVFESIDVAP